MSLISFSFFPVSAIHAFFTLAFTSSKLYSAPANCTNTDSVISAFSTVFLAAVFLTVVVSFFTAVFFADAFLTAVSFLGSYVFTGVVFTAAFVSSATFAVVFLTDIKILLLYTSNSKCPVYHKPFFLFFQVFHRSFCFSHIFIHFFNQPFTIQETPFCLLHRP